MENDVELVDSQETTTADEAVQESSTEDSDALKARLAKAEGYISDLKSVANVSSVKELREKLAPKKEEPKAPSSDIEEIRLQLAGHDADEINIISTMAKGMGKRPTEALSDPLVKRALDGMKAEKRSANASPEPTTRVHIAGDKTFSELSRMDRKKSYSQAMETLVAKARNKNKTLT